MEHIKKYDIDIETITPIHIGSGDTYLASECLPNRDGYDRINLSKYFMELDDAQQDNFIDNLINHKMLIEDAGRNYVRYSMYKMFDDDFKSDNDIQENIKVFNEPYIPGSSIKGAIRTALLYNLFQIEDIDKIFVNDKINESLLNSYFSEDGANMDILRFLKIKDSSTIPQPLLYRVFNTKPKAKGGLEKGIPLYLESIYSINHLYSSLITTYKDSTYESLNFDNDKVKMLNIEFIKESIWKFSDDLIKHEVQFCKDNKLDKLKRFYEKLENNRDAPLLKLGHGSGFLATTIGLKIKKHDKTLYDNIKKLIIGEKKKKDDKKTIDDFPITRLIIQENGDQPMGWVRLRFK